MSTTRRIAAAAMFAGLAIGLAAPATATSQLSGHYIKTETATGGTPLTSDWYFTNCGDGCASVASRAGGGAWGQARLVNGRWALDSDGDSMDCSDGTNVPNSLSAHYNWDANTLAGTVQLTTKMPACGEPTGHQWTNDIQLRQAS